MKPEYICKVYFVKKFPVLQNKVFLSNLLQEQEHYFAMAFSLNHVKALLKTDSVMKLKSIQSMVVGKFKRSPLLSQGRLYELLTTTKTV